MCQAKGGTTATTATGMRGDATETATEKTAKKENNNNSGRQAIPSKNYCFALQNLKSIQHGQHT